MCDLKVTAYVHNPETGQIFTFRSEEEVWFGLFIHPFYDGVASPILCLLPWMTVGCHEWLLVVLPTPRNAMALDLRATPRHMPRIAVADASADSWQWLEAKCCEEINDESHCYRFASYASCRLLSVCLKCSLNVSFRVDFYIHVSVKRLSSIKQTFF